ncbi:MAG: initiation control protein YabA [Firmicutes bacterium]|nr:initiation control protein YabA [Bacillota bacterium]
MTKPIVIMDQMERMERHLRALAEDLASMRSQMEGLIEENRRLNLENVHLRETGRTGEDGAAASAAHVLSQLYDDGYHICSVNYGATRKGDCLFCLQSMERSS